MQLRSYGNKKPIGYPTYYWVDIAAEGGQEENLEWIWCLQANLYMMLALVPLQQIVFRCSYRQNRCLEPIPMESPDFSLIPIETRNPPPPPLPPPNPDTK